MSEANANADANVNANTTTTTTATTPLPRLHLTTPSFANGPLTMPPPSPPAASPHQHDSLPDSMITVPLTDPSSSSPAATLPSDEGGGNDRNNDNNSYDDDDNDGELDWNELARNEKETRSAQVEDQTTSLLLARLEQENNALEGNPKSAFQTISTPAGDPDDPRATNNATSTTKSSRPLSVQQIRTLIDDPVRRSSLSTSTLRFSQLPTPQLTELEFWAALVSDYATTAARLPTLTTSKIHGGVPPPLRGVVWPSIAGALDDTALIQEYERLAGETSPYEPMIGKDIGRSFPNIEMFRDADGEGQRMLAKVLKCFSLYDTGIGYCQGLGFVVGPLLMHMSDREAFCVLVRLMNHYDLRSCFLPTLEGLLLRTYQFQALVARHLPKLRAHLQKLHVEPVYASQWFLSFFGVTCPMSMLLRIYDVLLVEGACETLMRVALSLMQRNEAKILRCHEFEDVMQLLLSRSLWDTYALNADDLVSDFVGLTRLVTRDSLAALHAEYEHQARNNAGSADVQFPQLQSAASRFLGRLWSSAGGASAANASAKPNSASAAPTPAEESQRSTSESSNLMVGRSPSKHSVASSTLYSVESSSDYSAASGADMPTTSDQRAAGRRMNSGDTSASSSPSLRSASAGNGNGNGTGGAGTDAPRKITVKKTTNRAKFATAAAAAAAVVHDGERNLHKQIEDLLLALSALQRAHAELARDLQREREERAEDAKAGRRMLGWMKRTTEENGQIPAVATPDSPPQSEAPECNVDDEDSAAAVMLHAADRFDTPAANALPVIEETKEQLREDVVLWKSKHDGAASRYHEVSRQLDERERGMRHLHDELRETRARLQEAYSEKQRTLHLHAGAAGPNQRSMSGSSVSSTTTMSAAASSQRSLRELKLGKHNINHLNQHHHDNHLHHHHHHAIRPVSPKAAMNKRRISTSLRIATPLSPSPTRSAFSTAPPSPSVPISPTPSMAGVGAGAGAAVDFERDELVQELATAKTSEAIARQELEEVKVKLDMLRRLVSRGGGTGSEPPGGGALRPSSSSSSSRSSVMVSPVPGGQHQNQSQSHYQGQGQIPAVRLLRTSTASAALEFKREPFRDESIAEAEER